jgi:signal transduction histidine kinase
MTERRAFTEVGGEFRRDTPDQGWRSLIRLRWTLTLAALAGVGVWQLYHVFVVRSPFREVALNLLWGVLLSLGLIQIGFGVVFRLFRDTQEELVEAAALVEVSHALSSKLAQEDLVPFLAENLVRILDGTGCFILLRRPRTNELEPVAAFGPQDTQDRSSALNDGYAAFARALIESGTPVVVEDVGDCAYISPQVAARLPIKSLLGLPLMVHSRAIGAAIVSESRRQRRFSESEVGRALVVANQGAVAIANAQLYAAEQREREVARTLLQITGDLSGTLHLDKVLNLILERLRVVVPYEGAAIGLLAGDVCYVAAAHDFPSAARLWGDRLNPEQLPMVARVLEERTAVIVADTRQADEWVVSKGGEDILSWLGVPLVVQDRTIGLLMLSHDVPGFYDQEAARLALAFAQHASLAIDNARLYEQAQAKLREQTLLHEMTAAVSSTLDAGRILRLLAERLVAVLGVTSTRIATLTEELQTANLVAEHYGDEVHAAERVSSVGEVYQLAAFPLTTARLLERQPLLVTAGNEPQEWREEMRQRAGQALLLLPLVARDRVTGFVELWESRSRRHFTEAEITLAQTLINQAAVAIDNARLFAETQRSISEMMLLYDIAVAAASTLELDTILQSLVKTLQFRVLEKSVVNVWLLDDSAEVLRLRAHAGELEGLVVRETMRLDEGLCGQVVQTGQPLLVTDSRQDPTAAAYGSAVRSVLCVPLAWRQKVIGVLHALSAQQGAFSQRDLRLLHTMAGSLGIAIENVRLFAELKRSEEALVLRNQALKRANDRLQELDRLKSAFIASVSHELRTPLNSIIGFSEVLLDGLAGVLEPVAHEYVGYIHDSGEHLLGLINDILDLSRIQAGRMTLTLEQVDVAGVVGEVGTTLAPLMTDKQQSFNFDCQEPLPRIVADRFRLKQVLLNLVGNASKFTPEGGRIAVQARLIDPATLRVDVVDNGPGIPLEDQAVIFEEFRQARSTRPGEGTGLGLAITRRLVELHGGRIRVESQPGAGATFTVLLPVTGPEPDDKDASESVNALGDVA